MELDLFFVHLSDEHMNENCGLYSGRTKVNGSGLSMRLNCKPKTLKATNVQLTFLKNIGVRLAEIEVHSIGKTNDMTIYLEYAIFRYDKNSTTLSESLIRYYCSLSPGSSSSALERFQIQNYLCMDNLLTNGYVQSLKLNSTNS